MTKIEQTVNEIYCIIQKDERCRCEIDYVEQLSWILFLKYVEDLENNWKTEVEQSGKEYSNIIREEFKWRSWAAPKDQNGNIDYNALTGDDLIDFVSDKLFPYMMELRSYASGRSRL